MSRTTITLTPEADALVRRAMEERRVSFRDVVNGAIIEALRTERADAEPYVLPVFDLGPMKIPGDSAMRLLAELDDEEFLRKMALGE
ncbi:hypothetical protein [Microbacterium sp.]|uniref:hypothetical protein n=1 Tax=Microbacterium sp. TaxID=51671 RepID=UPI0039E50945